MIVRKWDVKDWSDDYTELSLKDRNCEYYMHEILKNSEISDYPETIEIETVNRCNNNCSFCPVNVHDDIREYSKMTTELFKKIIGELAEHEYRGWLNLFSNNEPLLDDRIFYFTAYAREKLPECTLALYTNGSLLNKEKYEKLTKYLDFLVIDNYNDELELNRNIRELINDKNLRDYSCEVYVAVRMKSQVLNTRGGIAPNKLMGFIYNSPCILPFIQMVIRPNGKISRCCEDAYGNVTLGDLNKNTIFDVWHGSEYRLLREELIDNGRGNIEGCRRCDRFGMTNDFDKRWLKNYSWAFVKLVSDTSKDIYIMSTDNAALKITDLLNLFGVSVRGYKQKNSRIDYRNEFIIFTSYEDLYKHKNDDGMVLQKNCTVFRSPVSILPLVKKNRNKCVDGLYNRVDKDLKRLLQRDFVCYGAGEDFLAFRRKYPALIPKFVVDTCSDLWNKEITGVTVMEPSFLWAEKSEYNVLVTTRKYYHEIEEILDINDIGREFIIDIRTFLDLE